MAYKTGWLKEKIDGVSTKIFAFSHVKTVFYDYAKSKTLKTKLDEVDTTLSNTAVSIIINSSDLNDIVTPGFYNAAGSNTVTNKPSGVDNFGLLVIHNAAGKHYTQYLTTSNITYRRTCTNGTWSSWEVCEYTDTTYEDATTSTHGLQSATDKLKLDGIATGANKTTVDSSLSSGSTNPVQNKVIKAQLDLKAPKASPVFTGSMQLGSLSPNSTLGSNSSAMGTNVSATAEDCHAEGTGSKAMLLGCHAEGQNTKAAGKYAHSEGRETLATGEYSHAEGFKTHAQVRAHSEGASTTASGTASHAEGDITTASGNFSHSEGESTTASGITSHAEGYGTTALDFQHAGGHNNNPITATASTQSGIGTGTSFVLGNGTPAAKSNSFRVDDNGNVYAKSSTVNTGADYAEFFEWEDENVNNEDRRGYFVTLAGKKIKIAKEGDYILGIVSGFPAIIGNGDEEWKGRYVFDDFGCPVVEEFEYEEEVPEVITNDEGEEEVITKKVKRTGTKWKEVPEYDPGRPYVQRSERQEWSAVGMLGVLSVIDDGTCEVNGFCKVTDEGTATSSTTGYRVINRVNDHIVEVVFK